MVTATFFLSIQLALLQATFGSVRLGSVRVDSNYPAARTADCTDQSNGWDEFAFAAAPLDIAATDTQQGDACLDSSAVWPEESLP